MRKITYILLLFVMVAETTFAQKFTATASKTKVAVGETFQLTFSLNANGTNFKMPALNEFDVYSGPNQSTSMSFVNGAMSQSITLSYIIAAKKEGKVTITPASVSVNGANVQSNSLVIEVVKGGTSTNPNPNSQNQQQNPSSPSNDGIGDNLFVRTSVNKTKVFQGEQITVTHKVYTRYQLRGFQDIKFPDYTGFWSQDVPSNNQQIQVANENVDGVVYSVAELKKTFIFPQRSGKLQIEPMKVEVVVRKQSNKRPRDIFDQFFGGGYEDATYSVKSKPIIIDVTPLPEANKPANFAGAVGDFSFKAEVNKDNVKANDAINLTVTINGKGNIKLVDPLKINFPEDFETYDAKTKDNISTSASGVSGSKTFDYLAIPRHEGDYKIEPISFSYFDPEKKQYITLPSPEFKIHVDKGKDGEAGTNLFNPRSKEDVKVLGNDIRYIKTNNIQLVPRGNYFFGSAAFYLLLISPFLLFFLFIFIRRKHIEKNKDSVVAKSRKATKMAKKQLVLAEKHLNANNKEKFYVEIFKALHGYTGSKFNIPTANLNKDNITDSMKLRGVREATIQQLMSTLDNCEFAHYAPSAASGDLKGIYNNTVELITKIENEIK